MAEELLVDPQVSKAKFERELAEYRKNEDDHLHRGWWMLRAEFPEVFIVFGAPKVRPPTVVFGALLNFANYDLWPPSVKLVDPFTRVPYKANELPTVLKRQTTAAAPAQLAAQGFSMVQQEQQLMVAHNPEDVPFLCIPGVREYHEHPAHSGDSWLLHRGTGEGNLYFLLDQLYKYGVEPIIDYQVGLQVVGYIQGAVPE